MAYIMTQKYVESMPLYRQEQQIEKPYHLRKLFLPPAKLSVGFGGTEDWMYVEKNLTSLFMEVGSFDARPIGTSAGPAKFLRMTRQETSPASRRGCGKRLEPGWSRGVLPCEEKQ